MHRGLVGGSAFPGGIFRLSDMHAACLGREGPDRNKDSAGFPKRKESVCGAAIPGVIQRQVRYRASAEGSECR